MQQITRTLLSDGVGLTCVTTEKFKRGVLRVALLLPLGGESAALRAVLPHALRRGTVHLPDLGALGARLDELYGARVEAMVRKEGETLAIGFLADLIEERFTEDGLTGRVVQLLCDLLTAPRLTDGVFRADVTESEKQNLCDRIAAQKNDPRSYAPRRLIELMCAQERYGESAQGTAEQAAAITPEALTDAWQAALQQSRIELFYCGSMEPARMTALFAGALPQRSGTFYTPSCVIVDRADTPRSVTEQMSVTQGKLSIGLRTGGNSLTGGTPLAYAVFQCLYGGSTSSRLFLNVREKRSLCYYASAQFVLQKGILLINSGIENQNFEVARDEILAQLDACRQDITQAEVDAARRTLSSAWRALLDDPLQLEHYWLIRAIAGATETPEQRIEGLKTVTREQCIACAQATTLDTVFFLKGVQA